MRGVATLIGASRPHRWVAECHSPEIRNLNPSPKVVESGDVLDPSMIASADILTDAISGIDQNGATGPAL